MHNGSSKAVSFPYTMVLVLLFRIASNHCLNITWKCVNLLGLFTLGIFNQFVTSCYGFLLLLEQMFSFVPPAAICICK